MRGTFLKCTPQGGQHLKPCNMLEIFENRYDVRYLEMLLSLLDIDHLKRSAVAVERAENYKTYRASRHSPPEVLKRAVKIDFCGFASTTLLGATSKELAADIQAIYPEQFDRIMALRRSIHERFTLLLSKGCLKELNDAGMYLQIRFCFSYLYADFPISLMRAEDSNIWDARLDHQVSFSKNAPMTMDEWKDSFVYRSQMASLREVGRLCTANPSLVRTRMYDKMVNTFETRFAVIPIPMCLLLINGVAIADTYAYAKVSGGNHLAVSNPINLVGHPGRTYNNWRQHFLYIWRHDLTMYADMCTRFEASHPAGVAELLPPVVPGTQKDPNIDWKKKTDRIIQRRASLDRGYNPADPDEQRRIATWQQHVKEKMALATRKMRELPAVIDSGKLGIAIGKRDLKYYITLTYRGEAIFHMSKKVPSLAFCAIAHFAYAQMTGCSPVMHQVVYKEKREFKRAIIKWLESGKRLKDGQFSMQLLFNALFNTGKGMSWEFSIPDDHIEFNTAGAVGKASYKGPDGEPISCFSGMKPRRTHK